MGHVRLGTLPNTKRWRANMEFLRLGASAEEIAEAAALASERDLTRAPSDPVFQFVTSLLVQLQLMARAPGFEQSLDRIGVPAGATQSVPELLSALSASIDDASFRSGRSSDAGEMAKAALLETLSVQLRDRLPSLFEPTPAEIRRAPSEFSNGQRFAQLARDFFARLTYRSLDYYLSRELANHIGDAKRFASDADRTAFQHDLAQHTFEAFLIVEAFAGGWYGKNAWQMGDFDQNAINAFASYAFTKLRSELGRRRAVA